MMYRITTVIALLCLTAACAPKPEQTSINAPVSTSSNAACDTQARQKVALFDRPDTYPISDAEKHTAYLSLYNQCMHGNETVAANSPKPNFEYSADTASVAALSPASGGNIAALSPSAGGTALPRSVTTTGNVTVIDTAQLTSLSPAAGGLASGYTANTLTPAGTNGATVVVVQSQPGMSPTAPAAIQTAVPTHAAAIPVTPTAATTTDTTTITQQTTEKPKKTARAKTHSTTNSSSSSDSAYKRSRFDKNAVPVTGLNAYQPSAGSLVDNAIATNPSAQKY